MPRWGGTTTPFATSEGNYISLLLMPRHTLEVREQFPPKRTLHRPPPPPPPHSARKEDNGSMQNVRNISSFLLADSRAAWKKSHLVAQYPGTGVPHRHHYFPTAFFSLTVTLLKGSSQSWDMFSSWSIYMFIWCGKVGTFFLCWCVLFKKGNKVAKEAKTSDFGSFILIV